MASSCYVIVTSRSLTWTLLSIASLLSMFLALVSPAWLIGELREPNFRGGPTANLTINDGRDSFYPTVGVFNRCTQIAEIPGVYKYNCAPFDFSGPSDSFPFVWKISLAFLAIGLVVMSIAILMSILSCCVRSISRKSIFTISGSVQSFAGLFYLLGLIFYPAGWGSKRVELICGADATAFWMGDCSVGWALYLAAVSTLVTFACAVLSIQADISTSSDKVQDEILEGKNLICIL